MKEEQYEKLEEAMLGTSDEVESVLKECNEDGIIEVIKKIKETFKGNADISKEDIIKGLIDLYNIVVYRGNREKPRESGLIAYKTFLFSLHMAAIKVENGIIKGICYGVEKLVLDMPDVEIQLNLGLKSENFNDVYVASRFRKMYRVFVMLMMLFSIVSLLQRLLVHKEVDGFAIMLLVFVVVATLLLLLTRLNISSMDRKVGVGDLTKDMQNYIINCVRIFE